MQKYSQSGELSTLDHQNIYMGWNTDPYQAAEGKYRQTREALKILKDQGFSVCILTKSDLVTRDIDLISEMPDSSVGTSIAFQDNDIRELFEANAPPNERRIEALNALKENDIQTYTLICPVMPYITQVEPLIKLAEPYSDKIWIYGLSMDREEDRNWQNVKEILDRHFPLLVKSYNQIAFSSNHPYWMKLRNKLSKMKKEKASNLEIKL